MLRLRAKTEFNLRSVVRRILHAYRRLPLIFHRNDNGLASRLVLRQKTADRVAIRLEGEDAALALSQF